MAGILKVDTSKAADPVGIRHHRKTRVCSLTTGIVLCEEELCLQLVLCPSDLLVVNIVRQFGYLPHDCPCGIVYVHALVGLHNFVSSVTKPCLTGNL